MAWYKTGTISVTNGAAVVYGAGTAWVDAGVLNAGDIISINGVLYEILSIQSNTQLTLASNYLGVGAAGISYAIMPIGLLPSALAQQVKTTLATANAALSAAVRYDVQNLTAAQQQAARNNIAALGAADVGAGRLVKSVAGGVDVVLTAAEAANQFLEFTGTLTANISVIVPAAVRLYYVVNNTSGAFALTVKTAGGSGESVASGGLAELYCDGTNVHSATATNPTLKSLVVGGGVAIGTATITPGVVSRVAGSIGGNLVSAVTNTDAAGAALLALSESIDGATPFWVRRFNSGHSITPGLCELWSMSELRLGASNVEVMRFAAGGNVGIGTDSPNAKLQVAGSLCATGPSRFGQYTLSTLPSASAYNGYTITVSNAAGGPALCLSNGSSWINIRTNAPVN